MSISNQLGVPLIDCVEIRVKSRRVITKYHCTNLLWCPSSTRRGQELEKLWNTYSGYMRSNVFSRLDRSPLKNGTFDFGTRIGYVNNTLTFFCCSNILQLGKAGCTNIFNLNINDGGAAIAITSLRVLYFGLVCSFHGCCCARTNQHARSQKR